MCVAYWSKSEPNKPYFPITRTLNYKLYLKAVHTHYNPNFFCVWAYLTGYRLNGLFRPYILRSCNVYSQLKEHFVWRCNRDTERNANLTGVLTFPQLYYKTHFYFCLCCHSEWSPPLPVLWAIVSRIGNEGKSLLIGVKPYIV